MFHVNQSDEGYSRKLLPALSKHFSHGSLGRRCGLLSHYFDLLFSASLQTDLKTRLYFFKFFTISFRAFEMLVVYICAGLKISTGTPASRGPSATAGLLVLNSPRRSDSHETIAVFLRPTVTEISRFVDFSKMAAVRHLISWMDAYSDHA